MDKALALQELDDQRPGYRPMVPTNAVEDNPIPKIDFLGALWRRKSVVILLALIGAGLASLLYWQATPTYASMMRIMIWIKAPPSVVNGEVFQQQVALEKEKTLLTSTLVLNSALRQLVQGNGENPEQERKKLENAFPTFVGSDSPLSDLHKMLSVSMVGKDMSSDTLEIQCDGKHPEDLPRFLTAVYDAYTATHAADSEALAVESGTLIDKFKKELETKTEEDEAKEATTIEELRENGLLTEVMSFSNPETRRYENPYVPELDKLQLQKGEFEKAFREADQLLEEVRLAMSPDRPSDDLLRLAVIEAKKYFNLNSKEDGYSMLAIEDRQRFSRYEQRIETAYAEVLSLEAAREEAAKRYGEKHPQVEFIESKYQAATAAMKRLNDELDTMRSLTSDSEVKTKKNEVALQEAKQRDEELVRMYAAAMMNQRERAKYNLEKISEDIERKKFELQQLAVPIAKLNMLKDSMEERKVSVEKILEKLSALKVLSESNITTKVKRIDGPTMAEQIFPILWKFLLVGILLGGMAGAGLAVLIDHSDLAYRTPIDIQESLNVPVVCKVPRIRKAKVDKDFAGSPMLVTATNPASSFAETFRAARTSLLFAAGQTGHKVFMFTSPSPGDGKSTSVANLAISLAQTKKRVCLVDADYRRPRVQQNFGVQFEPGGMQYLMGEASLEEVLRPCEFQENLTLLTTGGRPKDPGELVASTAFSDMIGELRKRFDIVLIDCPPVIPVADATTLASVADGIIMILRIRRGVILSAHKAKERLDMVQGNLMGVIVNGMDENLYYNEYGTYYRGAYYSGSGYSKYYDRQYSDYSDKVRDKKRIAQKE